MSKKHYRDGDPKTYRLHPDVRVKFFGKLVICNEPPEFDPTLDPCWLYAGRSSYSGFTDTTTGIRCRAHRWCFEFFNGPIPDGLVLDHLCRVPGCCNPKHLEPVTNQENTLRGLQGRLKTHCKQGHEFTDETTYLDPRGIRSCKTCRRICEREYQDKLILRRQERGRYKRYEAGEPAIGHNRRNAPDGDNSYRSDATKAGR